MNPVTVSYLWSSFERDALALGNAPQLGNLGKNSIAYFVRIKDKADAHNSSGATDVVLITHEGF